MNEQLQSPLFGLPVELRHLIYRFVLSDGAEQQHVVLSHRASEAFLSHNAFRRGRYANNGKGTHLESPVPLLLTCRRIYAEALPCLYSLFMLRMDLIRFLGEAPVATLDRIRSVETMWQGICHRWTLDLLADTCGRLANLRNLRRLRVTLDLLPPAVGDVMPPVPTPEVARMLGWIRQVDRFEVHVFDRGFNADEVLEPVSENRRFCVRRRRESAWVFERDRRGREV